MSAWGNYFRRRLRKPTAIEWLVLASIVAAGISFILPARQWTGSGSIRFPVRVHVFDATLGLPIANAQVAIFRAPPLLGSTSFDPKNLDRISHGNKGATAVDGTLVFDFEFETSVNQERPTPYAHLRWAWVYVQADGFGGVVVPVGHDSLPAATLREKKELLVPVGLMPLR